MKILLTNDDGIRAPGIIALFDALADPRGVFGGPIADIVWPIAPLTVQSATSHGVTFHTPLMTERAAVPLEGDATMEGVAVDGRPADCVKLALTNLWPERFGKGSRPDVLISGMNAGANVGVNVIYSGTVAAAIEGAFLGVPSIAVSLHLGRGRTRWDLAAGRARRTIESILEAGINAHECLSVNVPRTEETLAKGESVENPAPPAVMAREELAPAGDPNRHPDTRVCPMNTHGLVDAYERRVNPSGEIYYWAAGHGLDFREADADTDVDHLMHGRITVTPLEYDLTANRSVDHWRRKLDRLPGAEAESRTNRSVATGDAT